MSIFQGLGHVVRGIVRRRRLDDETREELAFHLERQTRKHIAAGLSPAEAARAAAINLGGAQRWREETSEARPGGRWMASLLQDVRYAARSLRRDAGFTSFAVLIVGLGIGACATVFSLVNGVLLRPMPFRDPGRLVWISNIADDGVSEWRLQVAHFVDLGARSRTLDGMAGYYAYYGTGDATLALGGASERLTRIPVTCNFIPFLGVKPLLGRSFSDDECGPNAPASVLLTEHLWRSRFASDPGIVGRSLTIDNAPATVIGVLPGSFDFASDFAPGSEADFFVPYSLSDENNNHGNTLAAIGRLKPGVRVDAARAELVALGRQLTEEFPGRNTIRPRVMPLEERVNGRFREALVLLACAVGVVMLIVSANLSSLQFARMTSRERELGIRVALGAGRGRLVRQLLTENLVLTGAGAVLGIVLAVIATRALSHLDAFAIPLLDRVRADGTTLGVAALVAVGAGLLVGVLPALHAPANAHGAMKEGSRGTTRGGRHTRMRAALVVSEVAAACVLLVGAGLLTRSLVRALDVELGYHPERTSALRIDPATRFGDLASANLYYGEELRRVRAIPGVRQAALADVLPFGGDRSWGVIGEGQVYKRDQLPQAFIRVVSNSYFATMGIPILAGRDFADADGPDSPPVVIVNETLARMLWPNENPVGQVIARGSRRYAVVAMVGDVRHDALEHAFTGELYYPMRQMSDYGSVHLVVRTDLPEQQLATSVRAALLPVAPDLPNNTWRTLQHLVDAAAAPRRFVVLILGGFAIFALLLAALGLYALISYEVEQRTQELGIRMALGASAGAVHAGILGRVLRLTGIGLVIGVAASMALVRLLSGLLFGVTATDPLTFIGALVLLAAVALVAGYMPARRASRVDPAVVLRAG